MENECKGCKLERYEAMMLSGCFQAMKQNSCRRFVYSCPMVIPRAKIEKRV